MKHGSLIRYLDLFAGCGGLTEGFESTRDYLAVAHVDWDKSCVATLRHRLKSVWKCVDADRRTIQADIQQHGALFEGSSHNGLDRLVAQSRGVDVVVGGPPCQAYSIAGRIRDDHGMRYDYRNYLFESYVAVVNRFRPSFCILENVPGMLSAAPGGVPIVERIRIAFNKAGYIIPGDLRSCVIDMSEFGLPQIRRRVIILAVRATFGASRTQRIIAEFYELITKMKTGLARATVRDAIGHLPPTTPVRASASSQGQHLIQQRKVSDHVERFHSDRDRKIFRLLAKDIQRSRPQLQNPEKLKAIYTEYTGRTSNVHKYHVLRPDAPSNLIPAHLHKDGLRHIHFDPQQARSITVREAACLQGFPMDFEFIGSQGDKYKMIGNAVPPLFASVIARALSHVIEMNFQTRSSNRNANSKRELRNSTAEKKLRSNRRKSTLIGSVQDEAT